MMSDVIHWLVVVPSLGLFVLWFCTAFTHCGLKVRCYHIQVALVATESYDLYRLQVHIAYQYTHIRGSITRGV